MSWSAKKIVVPIDFSIDSAVAVRTALEMADDPSKVFVVHVLYPLDAVSPGVVWGDMDDAKREASVRKSFGKFLSDNSLGDLELTVRFGDPGLDITEFADEIGADLIVIPSHGYHGVKRLVLGSVTERVIRHAHCSVFVLRRSDAE